MNNGHSRKDVPAGMKEIFRPWITDPRTGERRYRKNGGVFRLLVPDE
jgi:hypothetical protein